MPTMGRSWRGLATHTWRRLSGSGSLGHRDEIDDGGMTVFVSKHTEAPLGGKKRGRAK